MHVQDFNFNQAWINHEKNLGTVRRVPPSFYQTWLDREGSLVGNPVATATPAPKPSPYATWVDREGRLKTPVPVTKKPSPYLAWINHEGNLFGNPVAMGELPANNPAAMNPELSIAAGKPYVFKFSSWSTESNLKINMSDLAAYVSNLDLVKSGLTTVTVTLTPLYAMPFSAWKNLFEGIGLSNMTDMYAGAPSSSAADTGFHPVDNMVNYWKPKLENLGNNLKTPFTDAASYLKVMAIAGAVIVGGVLILRYLPKPDYNRERGFHSNPRKRNRH